jgi:hypothetical protein
MVCASTLKPSQQAGARELDIEGRSAMSSDELIAALREHQK